MEPNIEELKQENKKLLDENLNFKQKIDELTEHLKKYTAPTRNKIHLMQCY